MSKSGTIFLGEIVEGIGVRFAILEIGEMGRLIQRLVHQIRRFVQSPPSLSFLSHTNFTPQLGIKGLCLHFPQEANHRMGNMSKEKIEDPKSTENVSVDVIEYARDKEKEVVAKEDPDATEYSSSFADTTSGNGNSSELSGAEVESQFFGDNDVMPPYDAFNGIFPMRKKKLTTHWRNFIRPLMWRCKWAELRIKELESQASKYDRCIAAHERKKHMSIDQGTVEQSGLRSLPFKSQYRRKGPMKRRKRKRLEDTTDIASYMTNHILFSGHENKWNDVDGTPISDDFGIQDQNNSGYDESGFHDDCSFLEEKDNDLEHILHKIGLVHTRVQKMKARLDSTMVKNAAKFSSSENLSQLVAYDAQTSSIRSPTFSACNGDTVSVGGLHMPTQHLSFYDLGDFIMPDAVSSYGEAIPVPDIIESTVGLLSSVDVTQHQAQVGDSSERIVDNILHNEGVEVEGPASENNHGESAEKSQDGENSEKEDSNNAALPELDTDAGGETSVSQEQSILKSRLASEIHFPKNKRKRGERKAGTGNWSRQRTSEPDSQ
ncbi:unnamed protein product [Fraxinus pennsylvanica]|uniref:Uncharacterized protein n=1 Tax=Fraxinus pennsylvanica TaxID=56036 RepID=A0AAD2DX36_9LAMI|nr:unnamed protein product [Fraxinus pennsylvanica]